MSILQVNTELLLEEIPTDGHSPLKFLCDDGNIYYCKYLNSMNRSEINFLAYEIIANRLLGKLNIPTPEIALVKVTPGTLDKTKIKSNTRLSDENICFGSKSLDYATELHSIQQMNTKTDFNRLSNPLDVIKIAIFDLWVNNIDRGKFFDGGINYNLLINPIGAKQQIVAFDNAFIFGGVNQIGMFSASMANDTSDKIIRTPYYKNVIKYISSTDIVEVINNFIPLLSRNYNDLITDIISELREHWDLSLNLDTRIISMLSDSSHIERCKQHVIQSKR